MEEILQEGRFAGLILHPSSLPNSNKLAGDFGKSAYAFIDYLVSARLNYWQVLPLGPCKYDGEQPGCPYLATSSFALNPLFVSVEALVKDGLVSEEEVKQILADLEDEEVKLWRQEGKEDRCTKNTVVPQRSASVTMSNTRNGTDDTSKRENAEDKHGQHAAVARIVLQEESNSGLICVEAAQSVLSVPSFAEPDAALQANFAKTAKFKEKVLKLCYERFRERERPAEFHEFCRDNSFWLTGYACFAALEARFPAASNWLQWPDQYKDYRASRKSEEFGLLAALAEPLTETDVLEKKQRYATEDIEYILPDQEKEDQGKEQEPKQSEAEHTIGKAVLYQTTPEYHMFVQYKVFTHWRELKRYANEREVNIFGDVAFYVNLHSSDVWTSPKMFQMDPHTLKPLYVSGTPPDAFCEGGQLWGHPVYDWDAHEKTRYRWWTQRIKTTFEHVDALRLDHFRGFVAYWRIPYEHAIKHKNASKGEWVRGPGEKLFDALYKNMGWMLPKKTIPAAMQRDQQQHVYRGAKKEGYAKQNGFKYKLRHMACWGTRINDSTGLCIEETSATSASAVPGGICARQSSPETNGEILPSNEPRLTYRGTAPMIVAEDLGLITEEIVILRDKYNILSMRVLQFAWAEQEKGPNCEHLPYNITRNCCVYTGTHDNDTLSGWWKTSNEAQRRHLMNYLGLTKEPSADEARWHLVRLALETVAHLVIIPAQDLMGLGTEGRFNTPGVDSPRNWSWQLHSLAQLAHPIITDHLGNILEASGRVKVISDSFPK